MIPQIRKSGQTSNGVEMGRNGTMPICCPCLVWQPTGGFDQETLRSRSRRLSTLTTVLSLTKGAAEAKEFLKVVKEDLMERQNAYCSLFIPYQSCLVIERKLLDRVAKEPLATGAEHGGRPKGHF
ncbi:hypothetical protein SKAU_G00400980 [Synaphobranchus kaupii]|uniref:Uncharacterized protein n=1 Tax=Synaphobranchus kaupii TaxID=118154 RepID=A0A9Q1E901_SYNKA|nr:hypothetical protein SKAU_G00400980 [Synaphobranchus kaupii]